MAGSRWKRRLSVSFAVPVLLFGLAEVGLRLSGRSYRPAPLRFRFANSMDATEGFGGLFRESPTTFWELVPGALHPVGGDPISPFGLRGPAPATDFPAEGFRAVLLGDSCTFGIRLRDSATFARRLEQGLRAGHPDVPVEVVNGGVPGFSLYQAGRLHAERLRSLEPDLVVLYVGAWNDFNAAFGASDRARGERVGGPPLAARVYDVLLRLRLVQAWAQHYGKTVRYRDWRRRVDEWLAGEPAAGYRVPVDEFAQLLVEVLARCAADGTRVVVLLPELDRDHAEALPIQLARLEAYREVLRTAAEAGGLPYLDLRALLDPDTFRDLVHPDAEGHARIAEALVELVEERGWVAGP